MRIVYISGAFKFIYMEFFNLEINKI